MTLTPDIIAKLIFATSQLRFFERELVMEPNNELHDIVIRWQCKIDSLLVEMGMDKFIPLDELKAILKIEFGDTDNKLKEAI